jgi:Mg2+-importing ATPase
MPGPPAPLHREAPTSVTAHSLKHWILRLLPHPQAWLHFGRHPLVDRLAAHGPAQAIPASLAGTLMQAAREDAPATLARLGSCAEGLSAPEAASRLLRDGPNEVARHKPVPGWLQLWRCYKNPFNLLLTALALLSWLTQDARATVVIGAMVVLSTLIRFVQERRSNRAAASLKALVSHTASVLRGPAGVPIERPACELVAGDVVALSAGDMVPADCRLLGTRDLFLSQSAMTGESLPVEKFAGRHAPEAGPLEQPGLVFMGTNVVSGSATALVLATGNRTYFGALADSADAIQLALNSFQAGVNSVSWVLIRFAAVMVPLVLLINGFTKGDWLQAFLFALSVAVGLTPEMLPMIVTSTLARGAVRLSRQKVVVKRLDAIQNFGAMDVLCTDKTGTLTQDKVALGRHIDVHGNESMQVLHLAFLNSHYQTGLKNLLDRAVQGRVEPADELRLVQAFHKVDELPFDFGRRRLSVVVSRPEGRHLLICKGALEEVLAVCTQVRIAGAAALMDAPQDAQHDGAQDVPLDAAMLAALQGVTQALGQQGLRVVAVAVKDMPTGKPAYSVADESALTLVGYLAFLDPPKASAAAALQALAAHGIAIKVLTGDNELVAAHVCGQIGLAGGGILPGSRIDAMSDAELAAEVERHQVFARLAPLHKERIVRALRANGHVVGFMGDGINDAPALRAADIGISVDTAVDIAREAADIILLEKSLLVLDMGVVEGRTTFSNMLKYIRMTASSNFGNVLSVLTASAFLPFLPMLPLQLLLQNLLYDISQTGIPFDNVDAELVTRPLAWNPGDIGRFMLFFGPISSLFDLCTFALMWWVFGASTVGQQGLFQSGWFVVGLLTQTLIVHMIRTPGLPFIHSRAAAPLMASTALVMAAGLWLPMGPLAGYFKLQALPPAYFAWLACILAAYALLTTLMKRFYIRRFGWQ